MNQEHFEVERGEFRISTDPRQLDVAGIHAYLTRSYWAAGVPLTVVQRSIDGSLCFGLYRGPAQIGFARVVTDRATFGYLADVYVLEEYRGRGLARWLMEVIMAHPDLQGLRRFSLATRDAHGLYRRFGFTDLSRAEYQMEILRPDIYSRPRQDPQEGGE